MRDHELWTLMTTVLLFLRPFESSLMSIQAEDATLADVQLAWLRMAAAVKPQLPALPLGSLFEYRLRGCALLTSQVHGPCLSCSSSVHYCRQLYVQGAVLMWWRTSTSGARR